MDRPNETKKMLSRVAALLEGDGALFASSHNFAPHSDKNGLVMRTVELGLGREKELADDLLDYGLCVFPTDAMECSQYQMTEYFTTLLDKLKGGAPLIIYSAHKHYMPGARLVPLDVLLALKQVDRHNFEIVDFQTYGFEGAFGTKDPHVTEYAFQIVLKKHSSNFAKKNLSDDDGQLMSLED